MTAEIQKTVEVLKAGNTIVYPTDTVWGIGCDATDENAVKSIYTIKKRADSKALICLVSDVAMLKDYVEDVPEKALEVIAKATRPTTIIYKNPVGIAPNLIAGDNSIAIRVARDAFCRELITAFGKPIVSTSANISGDPTPQSFKEISKAILKDVDYVVNLHHSKECGPSSSIIKIEKSGNVTVIRD